MTSSRVLARLVNLDFFSTLERRIGGVRAGSAGLVFALGTAGQRLRSVLLDGEATMPSRTRQPYTPTARYLGHQLAVSELYVRLVELSRSQPFALLTFRAEPACWWQDSAGRWVKPDAYFLLGTEQVEDAWAVEIDRGTESLSTVRRKLAGYIGLAQRGESGPDADVLPRVLVVVPNQPRSKALRGLVTGLPPPASDLIAVVLDNEASAYLVQVLRE